MYKKKWIYATAQIQFSDMTQFLLSDLSIKIIILWLSSVLSVEEISIIISEISFKSFKNRTIHSKDVAKGTIQQHLGLDTAFVVGRLLFFKDVFIFSHLSVTIFWFGMVWLLGCCRNTQISWPRSCFPNFLCGRESKLQSSLMHFLLTSKSGSIFNSVVGGGKFGY